MFPCLTLLVRCGEEGWEWGSTVGTEPWEVHSFLVFLQSGGAYRHLLASVQAPRD